MWFLPLIFFAYQFILRLWPGLMTEQIMSQYSIGAAQFGILASAYYYGYAGMQIPVAILLDKYSTQKVISFFAILCGFAVFLFIFSTHFYFALISRFLIGAGSAVGFLGVSKVISEWFPKHDYVRLVGFSFSFGLLGAVYGGKPLSLLIENYQWQHVATYIGSVSILIGILIYLLLRSRPPKKSLNAESIFSFKSIKFFLTQPSLWLLALSNLLMVGALEGFADIWGVPYLMTAFTLQKHTAAGLISFVFIGMLTGGPVLSILSKKCGHYKVIFTCGIGLALLFTALLSLHFYSWPFLALLFFVVGNLCCYQVIVFSAGAQLVHTSYLGITIALLNCINMLGGSLFHSLIGSLMDKYWQGEFNENGMRIYKLITYKYSLSSIPVFAVLGSIIIIMLAIRVKNREQVVKSRLIEKSMN